MLEQVPIKEFDQYIQRLVADLELEEGEKREIEEEWKQHLYDHYASLRKKDIEKDAAIRTVIEQFGDIPMIQKEVNQSYPSAIKNHVKKEMIIAVICIIASLIGPMILIGVNFSPSLLLATFQALLVAYLIHRFIIKQQTYWLFSIVGFLVIYIFFLQFLPQIIGEPLTFEIYLEQLFSLKWEQLTGRSGLFEAVTIHMMWYVIILFQFVSGNNYVPIWKRMMNVSFQYWAMLLVAMFLAKYQSSAQWAIIYLNVFLLYSFLQQTVAIQGIIIAKEKIFRLLIRQNVNGG